jgi:5-formyltetrahydrofolate cyclo-ligase
MQAIKKSHLRQVLRQQRDAYCKTHDMKSDGQALLDNLTSAVLIPEGATIGGYWATKSEVDVRPLITYFHQQGYVCALPIIQSADEPLIFREWRPGNLLISGLYSILTPDEAAPMVTPTVLLVPLLGFDRQGYRLGQGGGFYDLTLANLRKKRHIIAIGIAFDCQEVEAIPHHDYDEGMDYIVTPTRVVKIEK